MSSEEHIGSETTQAHKESQLIGSILHDEEADDVRVLTSLTSTTAATIPIPISRSTSAPPQLAFFEEGRLQEGLLSSSENAHEPINPNDPIYTPEYYNYYYSQRPLDPRLPRPLFNWSQRYTADELPFLKNLRTRNSAQTTGSTRHSGFSAMAGGGNGNGGDNAVHFASVSEFSDSHNDMTSAQNPTTLMGDGNGMGIHDPYAAAQQRTRSFNSNTPPIDPATLKEIERDRGIFARSTSPSQPMSGSFAQHGGKAHVTSGESGPHVAMHEQEVTLQEQFPISQPLEGVLDPSSNQQAVYDLQQQMDGLSIGNSSGYASTGNGSMPPPHHPPPTRHLGQGVYGSRIAAEQRGVSSSVVNGAYQNGANVSYMQQSMQPYATTYRPAATVSPMMAVMGYGQIPRADQERVPQAMAAPSYQYVRQDYPHPHPHPQTSYLPAAATLSTATVPQAVYVQSIPSDIPSQNGAVWSDWDPTMQAEAAPPYTRARMATISASARTAPRHADQYQQVLSHNPAPSGISRGGAANMVNASQARGYPIQRNLSAGSVMVSSRERDPQQRWIAAHSSALPATASAREQPTSFASGSNSRQKASNRERETSPHSARRNVLLEEFRLNNKGTSNITLQNVVDRGIVVDLAMDQYGSRFIQQKLEIATPEEKDAAFKQLIPETFHLCTDVFGNYVIQKFFEFGSQPQQKELIEALLGNILMLSQQMYGCRVVQKAIDVADEPQQKLIVRELDGHVMQCVKDQNGNHVIQKCIEKVPAPLIQFIVEAFTNQVYHLSTHPYGCRVIQRLLEHCTDEQRNYIMSEILDNTRELCKNQYGNYVIQHVLVHGTPRYRSDIIQSLRGSLLILSKHKFASNVIEKCFTYANDEERHILTEEVLGREEDSNSPLIAMVKDPFANYVIQKLVDVVDENEREMIITRVKKHIPNLRKIPYGKHILNRLERLTGRTILP